MLKLSSLRRGMSLVAVLLAFMSAGSWALAGSLGGIAGTITDASTGAPIPGVHLQLSSPSQTASVTTDAKGHFVVFSLQPDDYTLTAVKDGYTTRAVSGYSVYADQTQQYDFELTRATAGSSPGPP